MQLFPLPRRQIGEHLHRDALLDQVRMQVGEVFACDVRQPRFEVLVPAGAARVGVGVGVGFCVGRVGWVVLLDGG